MLSRTKALLNIFLMVDGWSGLLMWVEGRLEFILK